ncbi:hypothetical protein [Raoultella sp. C349492]|uniref:hypothetical protein n=1 Tax=Raoultella sp. C349492 TaxID=2970253 RepID=UPI0035C6D300
MSFKFVLTIKEDESGIGCDIQGEGFCTKKEADMGNGIHNAIVEYIKSQSANPSEVKVFTNEQRGNKNVH